MRARLLLGLWSVGLALVLVELGARFWLTRVADEEIFRSYATLEQQRSRAEARGESAFKYEPHHFLGFVPAAGYRSGQNRHNSLGFRGEEIELAKPEGEYRIVCLGGSTTYTVFVDDHTRSYPALLERELRLRGRPVRVVNAGAEGYSTYESLLNLELRVLDLDPDMIIVYHAVNDQTMRMVWPPTAYRGDNSGAYTHSPGPVERGPIWKRSTAWRVLSRRWTRRSPPGALASNFVRFADTSYGLNLWYQLQTDTYPSGIFRHVPPQRMLEQNAPVYFERNLTNMIAIARQWSVVPVLATFAYSPRAAHPVSTFEPITEDLDGLNDVIRALGEKRQVPVFDFAALFPTDPHLYADTVHVNAEGAELKARLFADFLERSGLLPE